MWEVEYTDQFEEWWITLTAKQQDHIGTAIALLQDLGPNLGRPLVDSVVTSKFPNMKELRTSSSRTLFAFDPRRQAILLIGGDKTGQWQSWYDRTVPVADDLYAEHLKTLKSEGHK